MTDKTEGIIDSPLRFALLCRGNRLEHWQARTVRDLRDNALAQLAIVVLARGREPPRSRRHTNPILTNLYTRYASRRGGRRPVNMASAISGAPTFDCEVVERDGAVALSDVDVDTIRQHDVDFVLVFGLGNVQGAVLQCARYGVWRFGHDDGDPLPYFREVCDEADITEGHLQRLDGPGGDHVVLKSGSFRTEKRSYIDNRDQILYEMATWPARACADIRNGQGQGVGRHARDSKDAPPRAPSSAEVMRLGTRILRNRLVFARNRLFRHHQWNIGLIEEPIHALLGRDVEEKIKWFPLDNRREFLADPFGIVRDGEVQILCEYFKYGAGKGSICNIRFADGMFSLESTAAIERPSHMSYPCLVEHDGDVYCIPETSQARELALYKAIAFPHSWTKVAVLFDDFAAVDPTIFHHEGLWWLTCTDADRGQDWNLFVWHAPNLSGPWTAHKGNPVKTDVRSARPGGAPFVHNGALYRPAQDCSKTYGWRIVVNRVIRLTPTQFAEEEAAFFAPARAARFPAGRHTLSPVGHVTLIDGHRFVFVPTALKSFLRIWLRNILARLGGR